MTNNTIATLTENKELKGIEIYFTVYPISGTRDTLKKNGFRWNHKKACWYAKDGMTTRSIADAICDTTIEEYKRIAENAGEAVNGIKERKVTDTTTETKKAVKKAEKVNKYGVKVGDYFSMSWGYDQTNVTTFQVIALVGEASVRVVEVYPEYTTDDAYGMAEDRTYKYDRSKIAPIATRSVFVDDCEKGDLHRVGEGYNGKPYIGFEKGYYHAYLVETDTAKHYVSWYH